MDQLDKHLKQTLTDKLGPLKSNQSFSAIAIRRTRVRRLLVVGAAFFAAVCLTTLGFVSAQRISFNPSVTAATPPSSQSVEPSPTPPSPVSDVVTVASGTSAGAEWTLRAYLAVGRDENTLDRPELCVEWKFDSQVAIDDFNCLVNDTGNFEGPLLYQLAGAKGSPPKTAVFGPVPSTTEKVDLLLDDGSAVEVDTLTDDPDLKTKFFVGFAPAGTDVAVKGFSATGALLFERGTGSEG